MKKIKKLGLAGGLLAVALLLGGCGAHAGFRIGKTYDQTATVVRPQPNDTSKG